jgi:hypothetical protein
LIDVLKLHKEQLFILFRSPQSIELSVKSSKESTEPVSLFKIGNKVVEVG